MSETATDVTTDEYNVLVGTDDDLTIEHPERKTDNVVQETTSRRAEEELQDDDESTMTWNFVLGMIFLALILSMSL